MVELSSKRRLLSFLVLVACVSGVLAFLSYRTMFEAPVPLPPGSQGEASLPTEKNDGDNLPVGEANLSPVDDGGAGNEGSPPAEATGQLYYLTIKDGYLAIITGGTADSEVMMTKIPQTDLTPAELVEVNQGKYVISSEQELLELLEGVSK